MVVHLLSAHLACSVFNPHTKLYRVIVFPVVRPRVNGGAGGGTGFGARREVWAADGRAGFPPGLGWFRWGRCPPEPVPWLGRLRTLVPGGAASRELLGGGDASPHSNAARDRRAPLEKRKGMC